MLRFVLFLTFVAFSNAEVKDLADRNIDLFKYDPNDVYTLPEDIDDEKAATFYTGDVQKANVEHFQNLNGNKKFKLELKTQNGIEVSQVGKLKDKNTFVVSGSYSFTGSDGKRYKTRYTADEFGYHPKTELDLYIPEPEVHNSEFQKLVNKDIKNKSRFQFLVQSLNLNLNRTSERGSNNMGDNYSYSDQSGIYGDRGYNYNTPKYQFDS